ncbi:MAG TPA: TIR domain-containing protein [Accumulibacter sp.]|uniref:SEFIR domain-containing protein n=3 Tax=Accumulibacter sp. TaxID=2053492 RepID=UPI002BE30D56|nr:SEFIR domain-containing protein [Accumulibacter sp.]HNK03975.1 TIR domain-containing protein [Accumulibacter sp.]
MAPTATRLSTPMRQQVFISYRHESPEHARSVHRLGEALREARIPVALDRFYLDDHPAGPDEGWPKWCEDQANESMCVLIVASPGWFAAWEHNTTAGSGLGSACEADLFRQALYDAPGNNARLRLVCLPHCPLGDAEIPPRLRGWQRFHPFHPFSGNDDLDSLVRWLASRLGLSDVEAPTVAWPPPAAFRPDIANRDREEWPAIVELLAGQTPQRIVLIAGASGVGKSTLLRQTVRYAGQLHIPVVDVNLKGGTVERDEILGKFELELADRLPNFVGQGAKRTHLLRKDLRALRQPVLLLFDHYEDVAGNPQLSDWLSFELLEEVERSPALAVIVAGKQLPERNRGNWHELARHLQLGPIADADAWQPWVARRHPQFAERQADLSTILMLAEGHPAAVASFCQTIADGARR